MSIQLEIEETNLTSQGQLNALCRQPSYQARIDGYDNEENRSLLFKFVEYLEKRYNSIQYCFAPEIGKTTEKPHYQGVVVFNEILKDADRTKIRNWLKRNITNDIKYHNEFYKDKKKIQVVSFTVAREPINLYSYTLKDQNTLDNLFTNIPNTILSIVPKWDNEEKPSSQLLWKKSLNAIKHLYNTQYKPLQWDINYDAESEYLHNSRTRESIETIIKIHLEDNKIPHKNTVLKLLYKNKQLDEYEIARAIGLKNYV